MDRARLSAEEKIRAAQAAGGFDNLPGAGRPLQLTDLDDPDWFAKSLLRREKIDPTELLHPTLRLRLEADRFPESLAHLERESEVRNALEDFNERVYAEWRRPQVGPSLPVIARPVTVDRMLQRWRDLRDRLAAEAADAATKLAEAVDEPAEPRVRRRWFRLVQRNRPAG
jgi:sugar phosphate isomerase/epimerase